MMELKGKKVLVVGLGKSGLAAALFLRRHGAQVTVSDVRKAGAGNLLMTVKDPEGQTIVVSSPLAKDVAITQQYVCQIRAAISTSMKSLSFIPTRPPFRAAGPFTCDSTPS